MWDLHQLLGSPLETLHVPLPPLELAIPRRRPSLRVGEKMKDSVVWAWIVTTAFLRKLLNVTRQSDPSGDLISVKMMRYRHI